MKMVQTVLDIVLTYLVVQVTGLCIGFIALHFALKDFADAMYMGFLITVIPTTIFAITYVGILRMTCQKFGSFPFHLTLALLLTTSLIAVECAFIIKDKVSLTDPTTWQFVYPCWLTATIAALMLWRKNRPTKPSSVLRTRVTPAADAPGAPRSAIR